MEKHTIAPYYNKSSEILILGSFPSVQSREFGFYYAHKQNRFWKVLSILYHEEIKRDIESKKKFLDKHKIALFDVCHSCDIQASSDASIKNVVPNDLEPILKTANIKCIYVNGKTAFHLYNKLLKDKIGVEAIYLPSTSSANAMYRLEDLVREYKILKNR